MSSFNFAKDRQRRQAHASAQAQQDSQEHAQDLIAPVSKPSLKQWTYLDGLARKLGHPHGRSLAADILHVQNWATMNLSAREASRCIEAAKDRIARLGREEGEGGVRGGYG